MYAKLDEGKNYYSLEVSLDVQTLGGEALLTPLPGQQLSVILTNQRPRLIMIDQSEAEVDYD